MLWTLIVIVSGLNAPVSTGLIYPTIDACYRAEGEMRAEETAEYNTWLAWAKANPNQSWYPASQSFMLKRINYGACVPHQ
jgi:hypothetical protein